MAEFFQEIRHRRVLPAIGFYVGSCWVLVEIIDRLVERYLLSPYFTDIAFWGLYSLIPAVVLVAWTHGKPGKDETTTAEKVGVPVNIIATLGLLITVFGGKDLSATANMITVSNEQGIEETHYVPNESFRRRLTVFFFQNKSGNPDLDWLQYGITEVLTQDLSQSPFVSVIHPWANFGNGFYSRLKQAGFEDGLGVPRSLMSEITRDANRQYFIEGSIDQNADEFQITARIWNALTLEPVGDFSESAWDLYTAIERISNQLSEVLEIPASSGKMAKNLPLAETYGESLDALQSLVGALNSRLFENDLEASNAFLDTAIESDPGFAKGWVFKTINHLDMGDLPNAQEAIKNAQELDYRLPAQLRDDVKRINYRLTGQTDKMIAFLRMQVRLKDDAVSHNQLALMLMGTGQLEEAKQEYLAALGKDALNIAIYLRLAVLEKGIGNMPGAIDYVEQYLAKSPEDVDAQVQLGDMLRDTGDLSAAQEHYLEASLLDNNPVVPTLKLSLIAIRKGNENEARRLLEQAEGFAQTPQEKAQVRSVAVFIESRLGQMHAAIEQLNRMGDFLAETLPPFQIALSVYAPMVRYYLDIGDTENARNAFNTSLTMVQPPLDQFMAFSEAAILVVEGELEAGEEALERGNAIIDQFKLEELRFQTDVINGFILRERGDYSGSIEAFQAALTRIEHSVLVGSDVNLIQPPLIATMALSQILNGELEAAQMTLDSGFEQDPSEPTLWLVKARYQFESGMFQLALASVHYALAIWKDADPDYIYYKRALELEEDIEQVL
jgi:tetratricopeptide (TPR) repeat protein